MTPAALRTFQRVALAVAVLGLASYVVQLAFGTDTGPLATLFDVYVATGLAALAALLCFVASRVHGWDRTAWLLAALALGSWTVGDTIFQAVYTGDDPPVPSAGDFFYLGMYPLIAVAIVLVARMRLRDLGLWLDGLVAGLTLIAVLFAVGYAPIGNAAEGDTLTLAVTLVYPIADMILLGLVTAVITMLGFRPGLQAWLLGLGIVFVSVADWVFAYQVVRGTYELGDPIDILWPAGFLLIALAAWVKPTRWSPVTTAPWSTDAVAAALAITSLVILVADDYTRIPDAASWLAGIALVLRAVRTTLTYREKDRALQQAQVAVALVDTADLAIFRTSRDGTVQTWNPGAVATFGREAPDALGRRLGELFEGEAAATADDIFAVAVGGERIGVEPLAVQAGGRTVQLGLRLSPIRTGGDHVAGVTVIARDLTQRLAAAQAERANQAKNRFLSRMSHELRTPLNAVLGFGQLLTMRDLEPEARDEVNHILKAGDHLLELINEMLEISHIESGRLALKIEPVGSAGVVREVVDLLAPLSAARGIEVEVDEETLDACVAADRQRLKQVLLNLLSNAIKFNTYGGTVGIRAARVADDRVAVAVSDTGIGIAADDMPRLFSPFERLHNTAEDVEGSGLGLALSKGLLEAMDGSIDAVSQLGQGSTFTIELPHAAAAEPRERPLGERAAPLPRVAGDQEHTVLYIEDNPQNRELMEQVFATLDDIRLITAPDGEAGLALAREQEPGLVLLDLHLPGIQGDEVLDRLRAGVETNGIPVIVVSADATPAKIDALLARGAFDFVTKPVDIARLVAVVDDALVGSPAR